MSANANFICYQGYAFTRSFDMQSCNGDMPLDGYGVNFFIYAGETYSYSIGSGITVDGSVATLTIDDTTGFDLTGLETKTITEVINQECCGTCFEGPIFDTKTGPVAECRLVLTGPDGSALPPEIIGQFLFVPEP